MITINNLICLMIYILQVRAQSLLVWNNAFPHIRKSPHNRRLSPTGSFLRRAVEGNGWHSTIPTTVSSVPNGHQAAKRHGRSVSSGEEQNLSPPHTDPKFRSTPAPSLITSVAELRWLLNSFLSNRSKCDTQNCEEHVQERSRDLRLCAAVLYRVNQTESQPRNHTMKMSVSCPSLAVQLPVEAFHQHTWTKWQDTSQPPP